MTHNHNNNNNIMMMPDPDFEPEPGTFARHRVVTTVHIASTTLQSRRARLCVDTPLVVGGLRLRVQRSRSSSKGVVGTKFNRVFGSPPPALLVPVLTLPLPRFSSCPRGLDCMIIP